MKLILIIVLLSLNGCAQAPFKDSSGHIQPIADTYNKDDINIPAPVLSEAFLPPPMQQKAEELFTVVVHDLPVNELLFALARDAKKNIDIAPGISGNVSLNAIDQTLPQILERLKRQTGIRYRILDDTLVISADTPYFVQYSVPYINMSRTSQNEVSIATQVASTGSGAGGQSGGSQGGGSQGSSNSSTQVKSTSSHLFWETLIDNLRAILRDQDSLRSKGQSMGSNQQNSATEQKNSIIVHQETGVIAIRASEKQHAEIQKYIDNVVEHALRQVLVEATIVEVELNDNYQSGIDWEMIANKNSGTPISFNQNFQDLIGTAAVASPQTAIALKGRDIMASIKLLDTFGNTRVLSSPKLMVLNNQTAILKVVENQVYFTISVNTNTTQGVATTTVETVLHTVPVGLVMNVTPQISSDNTVIINARPTISRKVSDVLDPNPSLTGRLESKIPVIEVREMESILKIDSGDIGVIGGLMRNDVKNVTTGTPGLSRIPYLDNLFSHKEKTSIKKELVVFLRPRVIKSASTKTELNDFDHYLHNEAVEFKVPEFK